MTVPASRSITSGIAWSSPEQILVHGRDLSAELIGTINLGDMAFLEITGRLPGPSESTIFNAMVVTLVEHGLTPSVLAARLTLLGAPESLQGAVAAGLSGLGSVFVGTIEGSAKMLQGAAADGPDEPVAQAAARIVAAHREQRLAIPGIGHPSHKAGDPRAIRLFEIAEKEGVSGRHCELMQLVSSVASEVYGKQLPVNATGAIGALASELKIPWEITRGVGIIARSVGLVGHLLEEMRQPIARTLWDRSEAEAHDTSAMSGSETGAL